MNWRSSIGRSRCERVRLYHAIHCTNEPRRQQSRLRRIVEKMNEVKRAHQPVDDAGKVEVDEGARPHAAGVGAVVAAAVGQ